MWVREVMTARPVTVGPDTTTKAALQLLDRHRITSMPMVDGAGSVVGLVSEADLLRDSVPDDVRSHLRVDTAPGMPGPRTVGDVMSAHAVVVHADTDLADAVELMTSTSVKSLPVVDHDGRVVGMVSRHDVVHVLARTDTDLEHDVESVLESLDVDWLVDVADGVVTVQGPVGEQQTALAQTAAGTVAGVVRVVVRPEQPGRRRPRRA